MLRTVLSGISDAIVIVDDQGRVGSLNPAAEALTGWKQDAAIGKPFADVVHLIDEATRAEIRHPADRVLCGNEIHSFVGHALLLAVDGTETSVAVAATAVRNEGGHVEGAVLVVQGRTTGPEALRTGLRPDSNLRVLIESTPASIAMLDRDMRYLAASARWLADHQLQQTNLVGLSHYEVFPDIPERWKAVHRRCLAGASEHSDEDPLERADGTIHWLRWDARPWYASDGTIGGIVLLSENITERKRIENELVDRERWLTESQRIAHIGSWSWDLPTNAIAWSEETYRIYGLTPNGSAPDPSAFLERIHPEDHAAMWGWLGANLAGKEMPELEFRMVLDDGETRQLCCRGSLHRDAEGHPGRVVGTVQDITARKRVEEALQRSEAQYRATLEQAAVGIAVFAPTGRFLEANAKLCDITGYTRAELLEKRFLDITHPEDVPGDLDYAQRMFVGEITTYSREKRYIRKDGTVVWIRSTVGRVSKPSGEFDYSIAIIEDISGRKRAEAERDQMEEQLRQSQKMDAVGRLAGGVAHDFNNMLSVILGYAELAMNVVDGSDQLARYLREIQKAAHHSADITRQLLAFARKQTAAPKILDLNDTSGGTLRMLRRLIGENIELVMRAGDGLWSVRIDPGQIDQAVTNLVVNARDAIDGVGRVTIETRNATLDDASCRGRTDIAPGEYVLLAVSDTGCGMDSEVLEHLFEPFYTTKGTGKGTGLGLATVYGIVKQNNGFIHVESEVGKGSCLEIYLPRVREAVVKDQAVAVAELRRGRGETVLLVEDEEAIVRLGRSMLENLGYTVLTAVGPREALQLVQAHDGPIEVLLTDIVMPEMNGRDLASLIVKLRPSMVCIFMSGYPADIVAQRGILEEGVHFIQKPFSRQELAVAVAAALEKGKATGESSHRPT